MRGYYSAKRARSKIEINPDPWDHRPIVEAMSDPAFRAREAPSIRRCASTAGGARWQPSTARCARSVPRGAGVSRWETTARR